MKKLLLFLLLVFSVYYLLFINSEKALASLTYPYGRTWQDSTWYAPSQDQWDQIITDAQTTKQASVETTIVTIVTGVMHTGVNLTNGVNELSYDQNGKPYYTHRGGATQVLASFTGSLYSNPPASSVEYLADIGSNLGIVKPAYAQGFGFSSLSPLLTLWKIFRDMAYLGFVVIFVVIGFMVMFRKRIDPRTVVTIQDSLPRIIIALILVTFSYAIVGLMVDVLQLSVYIMLNLLAKGLPSAYAQDFLNQNIFNLVSAIGPKVIDFARKGLVSIDIGGLLGAAAGPLAFISIIFIFGVSTFFIMFKIFFMLLGAYTGIVLSVIFAPIQLMLSALPGDNNSVASWFKDLLANILVFPVTLVMMILVIVFLQSADFSDSPSINNLRPYLPISTSLFSWAPPLLKSGIESGVYYFIAFGILFTIPAIGEAIKHMFEIKPSPMAGVAEKEMKGGLSWIPVIGGTLGRSL